jgi:hypothetical protein
LTTALWYGPSIIADERTNECSDAVEVIKQVAR